MRPLLLGVALAALAGAAAAQEAQHEHHQATPAEAPAAAPPAVAADDWAADRYFEPAVMARARRKLRSEHGAGPWSAGRVNLAEFRTGPGGGGYHWEGEAWIGGDINRLALKTEGEGARKGKLERGEVQLLYSRAISPYFDLQAGVRQDLVAHGRTYATVSVEGLAPYFIETQAALFLSDRGDLLARAEAATDWRLTQRLILQPRVEVNLAASDMPEQGVGSGVSDAELGLRVRYELTRQFAPYVGIVWTRSFGETGRLRKAEGERAEQTSVVVGLRAWF